MPAGSRAAVASQPARLARGARSDWWSRIGSVGTFSGTDAAAKAAVFLALVVAARVLGPTGFGEFVLVYTTAQIAALLADMGLTTLVLRQGARSGRMHQAPLWTAVALNVGASLVCGLGLVGAFAVLHPSGASLAAIYVPTLLLLTVTTSLEGAAIVARRPVRVATCRLAGNGCVLGLTIVLLSVRPAPELVAVAFLVGGIVKLACIVASTRSLVPGIAVRPRLAAPLLRGGAPFYGSAIAAFLYQRIDVLLLGALAGVAAAGEYAAAYRILEGTFLLPIAVVAAFLPSWTVRRGRDDTTMGAGPVVLILVCVGVLVGVELALARELIVDLLLGDEYASAAPVLAILALSVPIFYANIALVWIAYARGREGRVATLGVVALISNLMLNIVLINVFDGVGAALATVVTEAVVCVGYAFTLGLHRQRTWARTIRAVASVGPYIGLMLSFAIASVALDAPPAASCLAAAGIGTALLALVYRRQIRQPA
jgi:O-antigen/teichoic acid export membrane protein